MAIINNIFNQVGSRLKDMIAAGYLPCTSVYLGVDTDSRKDRDLPTVSVSLVGGRRGGNNNNARTEIIDLEIILVIPKISTEYNNIYNGTTGLLDIINNFQTWFEKKSVSMIVDSSGVYLVDNLLNNLVDSDDVAFDLYFNNTVSNLEKYTFDINNNNVGVFELKFKYQLESAKFNIASR